MIEALQRYASTQETGSRWLGQVPDHWSVRSLGSLVRPRAERNRTDLPLLSVVREKGVILRSSMADDENHNFIPDDLTNYKVARKGDLVVNKMKAWQGSMGIAPEDGIVSPAYFVFHLAIPNVEFANRLLRSKPYVAHWGQVSDGVRVGQWDLSIDGMKRVPILLPPPEEQAAIVRFLDYADRRIRRYVRAKQKLIKLLEEQKQAIIHRAVTRGLDPNVRLKPSGVDWLGEVPEHWDVAPLKRFARVQTGLTLGKRYGESSLVSRPYLRVANVQSGHLNLSTIKTLMLPEREIAGRELLDGDVLMTEGGDIDKLGRGCVWRGEIEGCLHQNHVFAVRPDRRLLAPDFLALLMASRYGRRYFETTAKRTTNLASTNSSTVGNFPVILPEVDEQYELLERISSDTSHLDQAEQQASQEIRLLADYRTRLVADAVTGKLDVRNAESPIRDAIENDEDEPLDSDELSVDADVDEELEEAGLEVHP